MHIKSLAATGVKGQDFTHELSPLVLFTGKNFSGKTSRLEAIRFVFLGHIPELGKQAFSTFGMIDGTVELGFDPVGVLSRTIRKVGDTIRNEAANTIGLDLSKPFPFLDAEEYFGLTEQERIQYIFRVVTVPDSYTVEGIVADLRNLALEEHTELTETAKNATLLTVEKALREHGISIGLTQLTKDKGLLKNEFAFYNKRAKDTIGAVRTLSELKTAAGDVSAETLESVKAQLNEVARKLESANQIVGSLSNRAMQANQVALRRRQIDESLSVVFPDREEEIENLEKRAAAIKVPTITRDKVTASYEAYRAAERALTEARSERDSIQQQIEGVEDEIKELKKLKTCPTCKAAGKNWRAAATKEYELRLKGLKDQLASAEAALKLSTTKETKAKAARDTVSDSWDRKAEAEKRIAEIKQEIATIRSQVREKEQHRRALSQEKANLAGMTAPTDAEIEAAAKDVRDLKEREAKLQAQRDFIVRLQQDLLRAEEAASEFRRAEARTIIIKRMGELLRDRQAGMIEDLFGGLIKTANYFVRDILPNELAFHEGEIGYFKDGRFISHKTFSGTEKALTYIAIAAALSKDAPIRLVLLDEMGRLDPETKPLVLDRFKTAIEAKIIDQVVAIDTVKPKHSNFWQIIELERQ